MSGQPFRARFGFDADGNRILDVADPVAQTDGVNLQTLLKEAGVRLVARVGDLPTPGDPDPNRRPQAGHAYLVKLNVDGSVLDRLAVWDDNLPPTGPIADVDVIEPVADAAAIAADAGVVDTGVTFTAGTGTGATLALTAEADGSISALVLTDGDGYAIGDVMLVPAGTLAFGMGLTGTTRIVVTRLRGAAPHGGWRFLTLRNWVRAQQVDPEPAYGMEVGDLLSTTQRNHEALHTFDGNSWVQLYSTDTVRSMIAALSLFEGTVKQVGGAAVPGAVDFAALPDLTALDPAGLAAAAGKVSHYWTFVGQAGYVIQASDPNGLGRDLAGAVMQVGDWCQIANRGTAAAADLHWVHIGGDLLARSRADVLYGLNAWAAGNYEAGSLVNHKGALYRATQAVLPADEPPGGGGQRSTATIQLPASPPAAGRSYSVVLTYDGTAKPAQVFNIPAADDTATFAPKLAAWFSTTFPEVKGAVVAGRTDTITVSSVAFGKTVAVALTGTVIGAPAANTVADVLVTPPWSAIPLTAGVHNVAADGNLPATAPASDVYLVLSSARAGGRAALYSFDTAAAVWRPLGSAVPLVLTGGRQLVSVGVPIGTVAAWVVAALPPGWLLCDGGAINAATYPELALLFPGGRLPDFRGTFLRGAGQNTDGQGSTIRTPGSHQDQATARPTQQFIGAASNDGAHVHTSVVSPNRGSGGGVTWDGTNIGADPPNTGSSGAHTHSVTITGGGDPETRPANYAVNWIIKATDQAITARP